VIEREIPTVNNLISITSFLTYEFSLLDNNKIINWIHEYINTTNQSKIFIAHLFSQSNVNSLNEDLIRIISNVFIKLISDEDWIILAETLRYLNEFIEQITENVDLLKVLGEYLGDFLEILSSYIDMKPLFPESNRMESELNTLKNQTLTLWKSKKGKDNTNHDKLLTIFSKSEELKNELSLYLNHNNISGSLQSVISMEIENLVNLNNIIQKEKSSNS